MIDTRVERCPIQFGIFRPSGLPLDRRSDVGCVRFDQGVTVRTRAMVATAVAARGGRRLRRLPWRAARSGTDCHCPGRTAVASSRRTVGCDSDRRADGQRGDDRGGRRPAQDAGAGGRGRARHRLAGVARWGTSPAATGTRSGCSSSGRARAGAPRSRYAIPRYAATSVLRRRCARSAAGSRCGSPMPPRGCSARPSREAYEQWADEAAVLARALLGDAGGAVACTVGRRAGGAGRRGGRRAAPPG